MIKLKRDNKGVALLDNKTERIKLMISVISGFVLSIIIAVSFAWLPYWVVTGRNLYSKLFQPSNQP